VPEGHTVHRLAATLRAGFAGTRVRLSSPQGRFATEAAALDGRVLLGSEAAGKHLLLAFAPATDVDAGDPVVRFVHVHLGLYGSWTFAGEEGFAPSLAIGAPRVRVGEQERAVAGSPSGGVGATPGAAVEVERPDWRRILPTPTTRLRILGARGLADLTGPTACEVLDQEGRLRVLAKLGPDPLRADADPRRFVDRVRNIYRAEALFRARLDPFVPGVRLTAGMLEGIWEDLVPLMEYGLRTGRIVTTEPEHRDIEARIMERRRATRQNGDEDAGVVPREKSFYVYHRQTLPCRLCGTEVKERDLAGRTVFWCPRCQTERSRRTSWTRDHPASAWAVAQPVVADRASSDPVGADTVPTPPSSGDSR
jgi:endonuclease-8